MELSRIRLGRFKGQDLTPDTIEVLKTLEETAYAKAGWKLSCEWKYPAQSNFRDEIFGFGTGRVFPLRLTHPETESARRSIEALWGFAVPLGILPWSRLPIPNAMDDLFIYPGPWKGLMDRLLAEGRGHLVWGSFVAACRLDLGMKGDKQLARFVQAQLHRIGLNPGPVDGVIGTRTVAAMETLGLKKPSLERVAEHLKDAEPPQAPPQMVGKGNIVIPGRKRNIATFGKVSAVTTSQGASLTIQGPGRIVVDVGEPE